MSEEDIQEQETEIQDNTVEDNDATDVPSDGAADTDVPGAKEDAAVDNNDEKDEIAPKEVLDSLTDDEFEEYLSSGKLPDKVNTVPTENKAKIISKPDTQPAVQPKTDTTPNSQPATEQQKVDYEAVYKDIFKTFKANGKEITPRTPEDVINLMKMGANYTKKMQLLAPMRRSVESLYKADIKENDLNFLIDVFKGDKEAIKNLLKKHSIDPMELDLDEIKYKENNKNIASDNDVDFSDALLDAKESLPQIQDIVNNQWDTKSKQQLLRDPNLIRALSEEIQMGRFDTVQKKVEQEKTFGRYKGVSDLEAYIDVVTKMVQEEQQKQAPKGNPVDAKPEPTTAKPETNSRVVADKAKAAPTKGKKNNNKASLTPKDIFSMSEEEFNKLSINDLI